MLTTGRPPVNDRLASDGRAQSARQDPARRHGRRWGRSQDPLRCHPSGV